MRSLAGLTILAIELEAVELFKKFLDGRYVTVTTLVLGLYIPNCNLVMLPDLVIYRVQRMRYSVQLFVGSCSLFVITAHSACKSVPMSWHYLYTRAADAQAFAVKVDSGNDRFHAIPV